MYPCYTTKKGEKGGGREVEEKNIRLSRTYTTKRKEPVVHFWFLSQIRDTVELLQARSLQERHKSQRQTGSEDLF